jgi:hypothetical protein
MTSGGLGWRDILDLLDFSEVMVITSDSLPDEERKTKLQRIELMHYRFDRSCNHEHALRPGGCLAAKAAQLK